MRRRVVLLSLAALAAAVVVGGPLLVGLRGTFANAWIRAALEEIADAWLVPEVDLGSFSLADPSTVRLEDVHLRDSEGRALLDIELLVVSLAEVPREDAPLRLSRLHLQRPVIHLRPERDRPGFVPAGWLPLVEESLKTAPESLSAQVRPSEVLDLRLVEIEDGEVIVEDRSGPVLRLDGIDMTLTADPTTTPDGTAGHALRLDLGQPPGFVLAATGHVDLDGARAWLDSLRLGIDLADPAAVARLSPATRALVETHELRGRVHATGQGSIDATDLLASELTGEIQLTGVHGAAGPWRLPIDEATAAVALSERTVRLRAAEARLLSGRVALSQADLALDDEGLAAAADWTIEGLALHELLRAADHRDPDHHSVLDGAGRVFVSQRDLSLALVIDRLHLGRPGASPVLWTTGTVLRNLRPTTEGPPLLADALSIGTLDLRLEGPADRPHGLPLPPADAGAPAPAPAPGAPDPLHWSHWLGIDWVELDRASLHLALDGDPAWELRGIRGVLQGFGGGETPTLTASLGLAPSSQGQGARVQARGSLDLEAPALYFADWSFTADAADPRVAGLLPPAVRSVVTSLAPAGRVEGAGTARFPLGPGDASMGLDLSVNTAEMAIPGIRLPVAEGEARLDLSGGVTTVSEARLSVASGTLRIPQARYQPGPGLLLEAEAEALRLDQLRTTAGAALGTGRLSGTALIGASFATTGGATVLQSLSLSQAALSVSAGPGPVQRWPRLSASLEPDGDHLRFTGTLASPAGGGLEARGSMALGGDRLVVSTLQGSLDLDVEADRALLPPSLQQALAGTTGGRLTVDAAEGVLDLDDPVGRSTARARLALSGGSWRFGGYRMAGLAGTLPLSYGDQALSIDGGQLTGLDGTLRLPQVRWSLATDDGSLRWSLRGLELGQMLPVDGAPQGISGTTHGEGTVALALGAEGLAVTGGKGEVHVRSGRLLSVPALGAMRRKEGGETPAGDHQLDLRYTLTPTALRLPSLQVDLGPVRYRGQGEVRWTGAVDVHLEGGARPGERATAADLAARLVAWDIRGTLAEPKVQALPLGIDTRTFDQAAPASRHDVEALPEDSVLGSDPEGALDDLPEVEGGHLAPVELGDPRDLDDGEDDW